MPAGAPSLDEDGLLCLQAKIDRAYARKGGTILSADEVWWLWRYLDFVSNDFPPRTVGLTSETEEA